ncbi:MAG: MurR/RpiR family transcriptional regulator [Lacisediminihabitans sp.]
MSIQTKIQATADSLSPASRRVADALMANPWLATNKTITELAHMCDTSETSVVRFCRSIGFSGYSDLRLALATEVGREAAQFNDDARYGSDINSSDSLADAVSKIAFAERLGIEETIANLDMEVLVKVIDALDQADKIISFGIGASNLVAMDLQNKLLRIGRTAFAFGGTHDAMTMAALSRPGDVAIALSHSGTTLEPLELLRLAKKRGALAVAITNVSDSPLAAAADLVLYTAVRETTFRSGAMASRTVQLAVIDCIFVGVAQRRYEQTVQALKSTSEGTELLKKKP